MPAAHAIYAKELTILKHGFPLWEPDCKVSIADVGYMKDGYFCRLFNASLPPGHPLNDEFGVPEGYEQLILDKNAHGVNVGASGSVIAGLGVQFSCGKDRGAVLVIKSEAHREDSLQLGAFEKYMQRHQESWLKFANSEPNYRRISQSELFFVTGHDKTTEWALAAFSQGSTSGGVQVQASFPNAGGVNLSVWGSWTGSTSPHLNSGPRRLLKSTELATAFGEVIATASDDYDQCIFIRGFRMKDRLERFVNKLSFGISSRLERVPQSRSADSNWEDDDENPASVQLLDYILKQNPEATVAIVHDDDLAAIIDDEPESFDLELILSEASPPVVVDSEGVGTISFDDPAAPAAHDYLEI